MGRIYGTLLLRDSQLEALALLIFHRQGRANVSSNLLLRIASYFSLAASKY